jgi:hypothetical protein
MYICYLPKTKNLILWFSFAKKKKKKLVSVKLWYIQKLFKQMWSDLLRNRILAIYYSTTQNRVLKN